MEIEEFLEHGDEYFLPNLSIDHVIIGYEHQALKCLLLKFGEKWVLPGGYIHLNESVKQASARILMESTGLQKPYIEFLEVFGNPDRQFTQEWKEMLKMKGIPWKDNFWMNSRFVTIAYYSLVDIQRTFPKTGAFVDDISWFDFKQLPEMWMDHKAIALDARDQLKTDVHLEQKSSNLLPETFTMPELHQLHQVILEKNIDRSRFQKKMLASGLFERLPKKQIDSRGRNPYQYRIRKVV